MKNIKLGCFIAFLIAASFCASCTPGIRLNTGGTPGTEIKGDYRVILFGCNYLNDLETIAFLDKEGDQYTFEPYAPDFRYRIERGVAAEDAFEKANKFLDCNPSFRHSQISSITAPNGAIIGYEIRPLYEPFTYGVDDVMYTTDYRLKDDKVVITIRLLPSIENMLQGSGDSGRDK